jgi:hypothetical protein
VLEKVIGPGVYASYLFNKRGSEYCNAMCFLQLGDGIVKEGDTDQQSLD